MISCLHGLVVPFALVASLLSLSAGVVRAAGPFVSVQFYSDANCTQSFDTSLFNTTTHSYDSWNQLSYSQVNTSAITYKSPICVASPPITGVLSGQYSCAYYNRSNVNTTYLYAQEYLTTSACNTNNNTQFWFISGAAETCLTGQYSTTNGTGSPSRTTRYYSKVTCQTTPTTNDPTTPLSSSSSTPSYDSSSSTAVKSNNAGRDYSLWSLSSVISVGVVVFALLLTSF